MTTPVVSPPAPAPPPVSWVPNRKVIAGVVANVLTFLVAVVVAHFALHESSLAAGEVSAVIGIVAGAVAGYMVKELPKLEADAVKEAPAKM